MQQVCVCGHPHAAHEHYRRGTDCAWCAPGGCDRYRSSNGPIAWLRRRFTGAAPTPGD